MNGLRLIRRHAAAFGRFAGLGSGITLVASAALVPLAQWMPWMAANALTTVASTAVATELHARVSFGHGRPGLAGHLKSAATIALGWLVTSGAVGALAALRPEAGLVLQQTVYLSATALVGIGRYLVLRLAVFAERAPLPHTGNDVRLRQGPRHHHRPEPRELLPMATIAGPGRVRKVPSSARRAGRAPAAEAADVAVGACSRRARRRASYWTYLGLRRVRPVGAPPLRQRGSVPDVARQAGLCGHGLESPA
ncbi:hypothetical protein [Streptomyces sp. NPDC051576]|uniref:hypothetical protein n=1 Tax=Streptomyces sp. NPDC051576 TaxID=3155803 RepID=UPI0034371F65